MVTPEKASFKDAIAEIFSKRTFWVMTAGATMAAFAGYALVGFMPLFIQYVHGLGPGETAIKYMAPIGLAATLGAFLGGYLTQLASRRSPTAASWVPGIAFLLCVPFLIYAFYAGSLLVMLIAFMLSGCRQYFYLGAQYNIAQAVVSVRARATSVAVLLFAVNLIGYGLGPPAIGLLADMFTASHINAGEFAGQIAASCNPGAEALSAGLKAACLEAKGEGMRKEIGRAVA